MELVPILSLCLGFVLPDGRDGLTGQTKCTQEKKTTLIMPPTMVTITTPMRTQSWR